MTRARIEPRSQGPLANTLPTRQARNNAIKTNYIKTKIDNTQQNSNCRLCRNKEEMLNHIISECSKLEQNEYHARLGGKGDPLGIVQEIEFLSCYQRIDAITKIRPREWDALNSLGFWDTDRSHNPSQ